MKDKSTYEIISKILIICGPTFSVALSCMLIPKTGLVVAGKKSLVRAVEKNPETSAAAAFSLRLRLLGKFK